MSPFIKFLIASGTILWSAGCMAETVKIHDPPDLTPILQRLDSIEARVNNIEKILNTQSSTVTPTPPPTSSPAPTPTPTPTSSTLGDIVKQMTPGVWFEIPNTKLRPTLTSDEELNTIGTMRGSVGPQSVIRAWCGAALNGLDWYFGPCGGHFMYSGNEVYRFDFAILKWSRLYPPRPTTPEVNQPKNGVPDCGPSAMHTYDGMLWAGDRLWMFPTNGKPGDSWIFDPSKLPDVCGAWERGPTAPIGGEDYAKTALLPDGRIALIGGGATHATTIDPSTRLVGATSPSRSNFLNYTVATNIENKVYFLRNAKGFAEVWSVDFSGPTPTTPTRIVNSTTPILWSAVDSGFAAVGNKIVSTNGGRKILVYDTTTNTWTEYANPVGPAPLKPKSNHVYSKWVYLAQFDVLVLYNDVDQNVWLYRLPIGPQATHASIKGIIRVCPPTAFTVDCDFQTIQEASNVAQDGDTIKVAPGAYGPFAVNASNITIQALGASVSGAREGKGAVIVNGPGLTVVGLGCHDVAVSDGNGACYRQQAPDLTLSGVRVADVQNGVLSSPGSGFLLIEDSIFERCGGARNVKLGRAHCVYASGNSLLTIRRSQFLCYKESGHLVKSRADKTVLEDNLLDGRGKGCDGSREIDVPDGGILVMRRNTIVKGEASVQQNSLCFGCGWARPNGHYHAVSPPPVLEGNSWATCRTRKTVWFQAFHSDGASFIIDGAKDIFNMSCPAT